MANKITVNAWGAEGSFARNVQHDPTIAVDLKKALEAMVSEFFQNDCRAVRFAKATIESANNWK